MGGIAQLPGEVAVRRQASEGRGDLIGTGRLHEQSLDAVANSFPDPAHAAGHDRQPHPHGLEQGHRQCLLSGGEDEDIERCQEGPDSVQPAEQREVERQPRPVSSQLRNEAPLPCQGHGQARDAGGGGRLQQITDPFLLLQLPRGSDDDLLARGQTQQGPRFLRARQHGKIRDAIADDREHFLGNRELLAKELRIRLADGDHRVEQSGRQPLGCAAVRAPQGIPGRRVFGRDDAPRPSGLRGQERRDGLDGGGKVDVEDVRILAPDQPAQLRLTRQVRLPAHAQTSHLRPGLGAGAGRGIRAASR